MICHGCGAPMTSHMCSYCLRVSDTLTIRPAPKDRYEFTWSNSRVLFERVDAPFNWVMIGENDAKTKAP